jgi:dihydroxy-acid dehydratase
VGHISPEAASKGELALIKNGDTIEIDIKKRSINVLISGDELSKRRTEEESKGSAAYTPKMRNRVISSSLKAYAANVSSADKGAVRMI